MRSLLALMLAASMTGVSVPLAAQELTPPEPSFAALERKPVIGRTVYVQIPDSAHTQRFLKIKGKVLDVSSFTLRLDVKGQLREVSPSDVLMISERSGEAGKATRLGLAAGVGLGVLLAASCLDYTPSCRTLAPVGAAAAVAGTAIGLAIGSSIREERILYLGPDHKPRRTVAPGPVLGPRAAAFAASVRF